jgi:hypothetical protein
MSFERPITAAAPAATRFATDSPRAPSGVYDAVVPDSATRFEDREVRVAQIGRWRCRSRSGARPTSPRCATRRTRRRAEVVAHALRHINAAGVGGVVEQQHVGDLHRAVPVLRLERRLERLVARLEQLRLIAAAVVDDDARDTHARRGALRVNHVGVELDLAVGQLRCRESPAW